MKIRVKFSQPKNQPPKTKKFKHSGDLGDLWYSLPVIYAMGGGELYLNVSGLSLPKMDGSPSGLTAEMVRMCAPLLEAQKYIKKVDFWDTESDIDVNLDDFRKKGVDYNKVNLCEFILRSFRVGFENAANMAWITCDQKKVAKTVFARSFRYRNDDVNFKEIYEQYKRDAVFVGLKEEHKDFEYNCGPIPYYQVNNFLEMAEVINGAELMVGNQSSPMALAIGLKKPIIQEVCTFCPNCIFPRTNAKYMTGIKGDITGLISRDRLDALKEAVEETKHLPGSMAELGVFKGSSAAIISSVCPDKKLHLFDTFEGIPEKCDKGGHNRGDFSNTSLEAVRVNLANCHNVVFHPGFFPNTTAGIPFDTTFSFVHLDADTYQSTRDGLRYFWPRMVSGGVIMFDDWEMHSCPGVKIAILELFKEENVIITAKHQCKIIK